MDNTSGGVGVAVVYTLQLEEDLYDDAYWLDFNVLYPKSECSDSDSDYGDETSCSSDSVDY